VVARIRQTTDAAHGGDDFECKKSGTNYCSSKKADLWLYVVRPRNNLWQRAARFWKQKWEK
jgi:hypothetical protein